MTDAAKDKVKHVIDFIQTLCTHTKGAWAGTKFSLMDWQIDLIERAFGTVKKNGARQYRTVYVEVTKKNGKSELASALALYGLCGDGEQGGEVYSAAGDRDQASLIYYPAAQMVRNNNVLSNRLKVIDSRRRIIDYESNSFYQVLSSESYTKHGINPSMIFFDELHAQPNRQLWDVLTEGTDIARQQQLLMVLTTAGIADKNHIGWQVHHRALQILKGIVKDSTFLPIIYGADAQKDDWQDIKLWKRVNPALNHIFDIDNLKEHFNAVQNDSVRINNFQRFRLNMWVGQINRYIPMNKWDDSKTEIDKQQLLKQPCYGGLDLSTSIDLTAFVLIFPPQKDGERWQILPHFWVPEENMEERANKDGVPYPIWAQAGFIKPTPGNVIDHSFIRQKVLEAAELYDLREVAYDPWGSVQLATQLFEEDGIPMVQHRQGYGSMSAPTKELLNFLLLGKLQHDGNPVLRWNADNLAVTQDAAANVKPAKDKSADRIDGMVALIMALSAACRNADPHSIYESRGIIAL